MPRPNRLDFKGAIHYTRLRGGSGGQIFFDPDILKPGRPPPRSAAPHLRQFERLVAATGHECQMILHGYSLEPNCGTLVLQTTGAPLHAFMRKLCGQYSHYLRISGSLARDVSAFASRYTSKIVAPEYLPHAVRRAHRAPVLGGHCRSRVDYPFSSERSYMGEIAVLPLKTAQVKNALEQRGLCGLRGYRNFMDAPETAYVTGLFENGAPTDPRIVGGKLFVQQVRRSTWDPRARLSRERFIGGVARMMNVPEEQIFSATRLGVLGRSLVAWHAVRCGAASQNEVGRWFRLTGATLGQGIRHYRRLTPQMFDVSELPDVGIPDVSSSSNDVGEEVPTKGGNWKEQDHNE